MEQFPQQNNAPDNLVKKPFDGADVPVKKMEEEKAVEESAEAKYLKETNAMQMALFKHWHGYEDGDRFINEWIPQYAARFHELFNDEIKEDPRLIDEWLDPAARESVIERLGRKLYGEHYAEEISSKAP